MNIVRRVAVFVHGKALELLLILAVILLIAQLYWPSIVRWWRLPGPGKVGVGQFESSTLARDFLIYLPVSYDIRQTWPLVVFLHGSAERGNDPNILCGWGPFRQKIPAIVAAPQCLPSYSWEPDAVAAFVRHVASQYHVDRERIYLVGYSMGAHGSWSTAAAHPELFAAIVPISGGGETDDAQALAHMPVWAFHGAMDDFVPVETTERMIEALHKAGGQPRLTIIPDAGHGICQAVCERRDLWEWLFKQHRVK